MSTSGVSVPQFWLVEIAREAVGPDVESVDHERIWPRIKFILGGEQVKRSDRQSFDGESTPASVRR